jgi:cellulose synthase/poly-beta-1,6-N-acetylglucosamine synthase-like glycosyltransferase
LAYWQLHIWPTTRPFYKLDTYAYETRFMEPLSTVGAVARRELLLSRHLFAYDWFAPTVRWAAPRKVVMQTESLGSLETWGRAALVLWSALLLLSVYLLFRYRLYRRTAPLGLLLCLLFNIALHTKYGDDLFLYSCNTCFLILALVALCTMELRLTLRRALAFDLALLLLLSCEILNNQVFVRRLWSVYTQHVLF